MSKASDKKELAKIRNNAYVAQASGIYFHNYANALRGRGRKKTHTVAEMAAKGITHGTRGDTGGDDRRRVFGDGQ